MGLSVHLKIFCLDIFVRCALLHVDHEHSFWVSSSHDLDTQNSSQARIIGTVHSSSDPVHRYSERQDWRARSAKPGNSRWRSTCSKRCHGCDPKAAARPHPSSAARCLFSPMGVSDDSAPTEHFFIVLSRKRLV